MSDLEKNLIKLEKSIIGKMNSIKGGTLTPADSGIGKLFNLLKSLDEPLHIKLMEQYKNILSNLKKS